MEAYIVTYFSLPEKPMPIGSIFGALFFGGLCSWVGLTLLGAVQPAAKLAGLSLTLLGLSLAGGLLLRRSWARWAGVLCAFLVVLLVITRDADPDSAVLAYLLLLGSLAVAILLLLPVTGDPWRGRPPTSTATASRAWSKALGPAVTALSATGLVAGLWLSAAPVESDAPTPVAGGVDLPRSAIGQRVQWSDFAAGVTRARAEGKPMLVTFFTTWCPYCKKMDQSTWRAGPVVERLSQVVAVRIDAEDTVARNGYSGQDLAERYEVRGFPATLLMDHAGRVLSRADGYLRPAELLEWLDGALARSAAAGSQAARRSGR